MLLNMKPLSEVAPGLLVIQIQIQAVWFVIQFPAYWTEILLNLVT